MKLEKSFIYKNFRKDLNERYGEQMASEIWAYANEELQKIEAAEIDKDHTNEKFLYPAVALYRAIEHYMPGDALPMTRAYGTKYGLHMKKLFSKVTAIPGIPTLMWNNMDKIAAMMSNGYECENMVVTEHQCDLDVIRCPLYDKAKMLGTPEAAQMICCMDKEYMTGFRGIEYKRTRSVAEGDECCDYRLKDSRSKKSITDNFGHPRGRIGRMMLKTMDKEHRPLAEWGLGEISVPENADIVDIGCGGGYNIKRILSKFSVGKIFGFDISEESVKLAKENNKGSRQVKILQGSVEKMPFKDSILDLATAFETVYFWPDPVENFREVRRVLKEGGQFAVINNYGDPDIDWEKKVPCMKRYKAEAIVEFMEQAGFKDVRLTEKDNMYCVIGKKCPCCRYQSKDLQTL